MLTRSLAFIAALAFAAPVGAQNAPVPGHASSIVPGTTGVVCATTQNVLYSVAATAKLACGVETFLPLVAGAPAASANAALINNAMVAYTAIVLPPGDYYIGATIVPVSNVSVVSSGITKLIYTGAANAVENSSSAVLVNFNWINVGVDAGTGTGAAVTHSPYNNIWQFGPMAMTNATGTFIKIIADVTSGPTNPSGNYNAAFNKFDRAILGSGSYTGTCFSVAGAGSPTVLTGVATLNTFGDIGCLDARIAGLDIGHWVDSETFTGTANFSMTAASAVCLNFNSSADATKTVYNITMAHVSCAQYTSLASTIAVKLGYVRDIVIGALLPDTLVGTQFSSLLTADATGTASYDITFTGNDPFGSEALSRRLLGVKQTNLVIGDDALQSGGLIRASGADSGTLALINGGTKGVRFGANGTGSLVEGVDNTGVGSYQPLVVGGSTVTMQVSGADTLTANGGGVAVASGKALALGNAYVNTPSVSTGYLLITDVNGTVYEIPAKAH